MMTSNSKMRFAKRVHLACLPLLLAACDGASSVGSDSCPRGWTCVTADAVDSSDDIVEVPTRAALLTATLSRPLDPATEPGGDGSWSLVFLPTADGSLWMFGPAGEGLRATRLDGDAQVIAHTDYAPPAGVKTSADGSLYRAPRAVPDPHGFLVNVSWASRTGETFRYPDGTTAQAAEPSAEWFLFSDDADAPPSRVRPAVATVRELTYAARTADGSGILLLSPGGDAERLDVHGVSVWKAPIYRPLYAWGAMVELDINARYGLVARGRSGDLRIPLSSVPDAASPVPALTELRISEAGAVTLTAQTGVSAPSSINSANVNVGPDAAIWYLRDGYDGDVLALTAKGAGFRGYRFIREDYTDLMHQDTVAAPDGTLFFSTLSGGRADSEQQRLVCRVRDADAACFAVAEGPEAIAIAPLSANVIVTVRDGVLSRFELPE